MSSGGGGGGMSGTQKGIMKRQYTDKKDIENYLRQAEQLPRGFREDALRRQAGLYGLEGGVGSQQALIDQARQSPLYGSIMGNWENSRREGEEAIMRNAAMTGGLRSGNIQDALYRYNLEGQNQAQNLALLQSYNQQLMGLQGLTQTQPMPSQLPGMYGSNVSTAGPGRGEGGGGFGGFMGGALSGGMAGYQIGGPWGAAGGAILGGLGGM
jgi:hypothetical protein